jgi:ribosome-associated toxin RatA of RatAB toxin-antitoxin module
MALVEKSVLIERTPAQMFVLVDRIEDYPQFLALVRRQHDP